MSCFTGGCGCMKDLGLLALRIGVGIPFIIHGIAKLMDIAGTTGFFMSINLGYPLVYIVAILEILAGAMILLGIYSAIGGWIVAIVMAGAYIIIGYKMPFFGGSELVMVYFFAGLAIAMLGSGKYSIKRDACCGTCSTNKPNIVGSNMNSNTCTHMNCKCGDCGKCN